jgi:inorganic pyrophosphatase
MNIDLIPVGKDPPHNVNVIIEVPVGGEPVKYEFDKLSGAIFVDRILHTSMRYPANYGFIPHTLCDDGDPLDCLVVARSPFIPGSVVRARPIAVLLLEDEAAATRRSSPCRPTRPSLITTISRRRRPARDRQAADRAFLHPL